METGGPGPLSFIEIISEYIAQAIIRANEAFYVWYRNKTAPYYVLPLPPSFVERPLPSTTEPQPKEVDMSREDR